MEGQGMSWKVIEGLFLSSDCHFKREKLLVVCAVGYVGMCSQLCCGGLQDYSDSLSPIPTLDLNFLDLDWTELDLGLRNWTWACQYAVIVEQAGAIYINYTNQQKVSLQREI